ncbi:hypothetical protein DFH11DRAFT_1733505 [Phellopilus nigrolimitatus]|nr:hypothetical protein DFH11DRAFT_1733505 [Phellopilus nigrolimitatus]
MYDIFPFCATLRSLRLRFIHRDNLAAFLKSEYSLLLPNSLAELRITVGIKGSTGGRDILDGWDTRFVEILSTLPSLRAFTMPQIQDLAHWDGPDGRAYVDNFPLNLPKTEYHCAEHGFNLVFCPRQNPN